MAAPEDGDDEALRARLKNLSSALDGKPPAAQPGSSEPPRPEGIAQAMSLGFRVMSEFVAAVVVGAVIGWTIDHWIGSSPAGLIIFVALGTAAGFWNVYRIAAKPTDTRGGR